MTKCPQLESFNNLDIFFMSTYQQQNTPFFLKNEMAV